LISLYLTDSEEHLTQIAQARGESAFKRIAREAHIIAGTAGNMGAISTSHIAQQLEASAITQDAGRVEELTKKLFGAARESSAELRRWLDDHPAAGDSAARAER